VDQKSKKRAKSGRPSVWRDAAVVAAVVASATSTVQFLLTKLLDSGTHEVLIRVVGHGTH
jgi:hypothetical protein